MKFSPKFSSLRSLCVVRQRWDPYDSYPHDSDLFILFELLNLRNCIVLDFPQIQHTTLVEALKSLSYRSNRRTDGRTFFFADSASLGIDNQLCPWKHMFFPRVTNVNVNLWDLVLRTGLIKHSLKCNKLARKLIFFAVFNFSIATMTKWCVLLYKNLT